jgi:hypothetical protein
LAVAADSADVATDGERTTDGGTAGTAPDDGVATRAPGTTTAAGAAVATAVFSAVGKADPGAAAGPRPATGTDLDTGSCVGLDAAVDFSVEVAVGGSVGAAAIGGGGRRGGVNGGGGVSAIDGARDGIDGGPDEDAGNATAIGDRGRLVSPAISCFAVVGRFSGVTFSPTDEFTNLLATAASVGARAARVVFSASTAVLLGVSVREAAGPSSFLAASAGGRGIPLSGGAASGCASGCAFGRVDLAVAAGAPPTTAAARVWG